MTIEEMNEAITEFCNTASNNCSLCPLHAMKREGLIDSCDEEEMSDEMVVEAYNRITICRGIEFEFEPGDVSLAELFGL